MRFDKLILLLTLSWTVPALAKGPPPRRPAIAVMDIEATGIPPDQLAALGEVLTTELTATQRYEVISASDIKALLQHEATRQSLGCDEASCFAEIGGALGADNLLVSQVSRIEETYVLSMKLIDVAHAKTLRRVYERVDGDLDDLLDAIRYSVGALVDPEAGEGVVRGRPLVSKTPLLLGGVSLAALGVGVGFGIQARVAHDHATDSSYAGGQLEVSKGRTAQMVANVGFVTSAAAAVAGTLLFLLWDTDLFDSTVTVSPTVDGPGLSLQLRY